MSDTALTEAERRVASACRQIASAVRLGYYDMRKLNANVRAAVDKGAEALAADIRQDAARELVRAAPKTEDPK